jgi:hypothetical protein
MALRELGRNLAVSLMGIAVATTADISRMWLTNPLTYLESEPPWHFYTGPLWAALILSVPVAIGYFATRLFWLQTALAYCVFSVIGRIWAESSISGYSYQASFSQALDRISVKYTLIGILIACTLAQIGVWLKGWRTGRTRVPARSKQG